MRLDDRDRHKRRRSDRRPACRRSECSSTSFSWTGRMIEPSIWTGPVAWMHQRFGAVTRFCFVEETLDEQDMVRDGGRGAAAREEAVAEVGVQRPGSRVGAGGDHQ